jgi:hypothetical protein
MVRSDVQHAAPDKNWLTPQGGARMCAGNGAPSKAASPFILRHAYRNLRTGIWICYTPKIRGFVVLFARVEARIETIEIAAHRSFFAVLTLSRYVNRITGGAGVRQ